MGRGGYNGGHSVWYSDTARAKTYRRIITAANFSSGYGGRPQGHWEGKRWVADPPKQLPEPKRPRRHETASFTDAQVADWLRRTRRTT